jgi:starch synthase
MDGTHRIVEARASAGIVPAASRRVLQVAGEIYPLAKTGGLGDVCGALPQATAEFGIDSRLLMPAYPGALEAVVAPRVLVELGPVLGVDDVRVLAGRMPDSALPVWLVDCPALFRRPGGPYLDPAGSEWPDNGLRFALLGQVAAQLARHGSALTGWQPDIVHCHDWHGGLVPLLLANDGPASPRTVFTIHNMAFQGNQPMQLAGRLGVPDGALGPDGAEFYGQLSFLKAGIRYADRVTTVSPGYARELLTAEYGCGMDGLLRSRGADFRGILNGIDTTLWDPAGDPHLVHRYDADHRAGKAACKAALQAELGFEVDAGRPLAIMVSRLTGQKMADLVLAELPALLERHPGLQFALLGCGERPIEEGFRRLAAACPARVSVRIGYDEPAAHRLHAGADLLLHGSRFEPCGLVQMYAMRYGTLPVVSRVGGLADTVADLDASAHPTGFVFDGSDGAALRAAVGRALDTWHTRPADWRRLQGHAMRRDFGWRRSALQYLALFVGLTPDAPEPRAAHGSAAALACH